MKVAEATKALNSSEDDTHLTSDDDDEEARWGDMRMAPEVGLLPQQKKAVGCCCGCCAVTSVLLVVGIIFLVVSLNSFLKLAIEQVGGSLMGTPVTLGSINFNAVAGRVSITELDVASPKGYTNDLFNLGRFVFDVSPLSLLWGWMSDFTKPIELEDLTVKNIDVWINMQTLPTPSSNAQEVVTHMNQQVDRLVEIAPQLTTPMPTLSPTDTLKVGMAKIKADRLELSNISASVTLQPLAPVTFTLPRILIEDVGKKHNGVYLYEFIEIFIRAVLMAVIKGAPTTVRSDMAKGFGKELWRSLDMGSIDLDMGHGLEQLGEFSGWVSTEAALLPLRAAETSAELTAKAAKAGVDVNTEALKIGTKLTGMGIAASAKAANMGVQANAKAAEAMADLSTGFTNGLTQALTR